jgi:hypothetical protein
MGVPVFGKSRGSWHKPEPEQHHENHDPCKKRKPKCKPHHPPHHHKKHRKHCG